MAANRTPYPCRLLVAGGLAVTIVMVVPIRSVAAGDQPAEVRAQGYARWQNGPAKGARNDYGLTHLDEKTIVGWMHGDEPDNAQSLPGGKGYGPPILPENAHQWTGDEKARLGDDIRRATAQWKIRGERLE